jgi:hypothetical protein
MSDLTAYQIIEEVRKAKTVLRLNVLHCWKKTLRLDHKDREAVDRAIARRLEELK